MPKKINTRDWLSLYMRLEKRSSGDRKAFNLCAVIAMMSGLYLT